jgi:hypothetical protein
MKKIKIKEEEGGGGRGRRRRRMRRKKKKQTIRTTWQYRLGSFFSKMTPPVS